MQLMDLQQKQIDELADWLTVAEQRINSSEVIGSDLDTVRHQVEDHKVPVSVVVKGTPSTDRLFDRLFLLWKFALLIVAI